ncbi:MAG: hypothetical protein KAT15_06475, partial [Bacteroidales bacterium]|nr:hypothetical protein [Bacteroidales bacterium]
MNVLDFKKIFPTLVLLFFFLISPYSQDTLYDCKIELKEDVLSFRNSQFIIEFQWLDGDIRGRTITNLNTAHTWKLPEGSHGNLIVPDSLAPISAGLKVFQVLDHVLYPDHLVGEITTKYEYFEIRRTYRLYPGIGALKMNL